MLCVPNFADQLCDEVRTKKSILCCGLDPQLRYMPAHLIRQAIERHAIEGDGKTFAAIGWLFYEFNRQIIDVLQDIVVCVKPQLAFYEIYGSEGIKAYEQTVLYARKMGLFVIADAKRGDGGNTADAYADGYLGQVPFFGNKRAFSPVGVDCMTIHGYIGEACVIPFVNRVIKYGAGIFVVAKTSFKPNSAVEQFALAPGRPVWQEVASLVQKWGEGTEGLCGLRNVGVVVGATYPDDAAIMRGILPNAIFLKPGYGGQGASAQHSVIGIRKDGFGIVVNNSRNLTYAWQNKNGKHQCEPEKFAEAARLEAINNRDELVAAARQSGNWPF